MDAEGVLHVVSLAVEVNVVLVERFVASVTKIIR
jgi:hypothetical protein